MIQEEVRLCLVNYAGEAEVVEMDKAAKDLGPSKADRVEGKRRRRRERKEDGEAETQA